MALAPDVRILLRHGELPGTAHGVSIWAIHARKRRVALYRSGGMWNPRTTMQRAAHIRQVRETVAAKTSAAQSRLAASWCRSMNRHGLDPSANRPPFRLSDSEMRARLEGFEPVLRLAAPRLDYLFSLVGASGSAVVLSDADGIIMDQRCHDGDGAGFRKRGLWRAADWSEAREGTNGIGTCLFEHRPVVIHRNEHFLARNIPISACAAPVFGPEGGAIGALEVSSVRAHETAPLNRLFSAMVAQIAGQIEADLLRAAYPRARIVVAGSAGFEPAALLAVDSDDLVIGANREARRQLDLGNGGPLRPRPAVDLLGGRSGNGGFPDAERSALIRALARAEGNVSAAARALEISRATLYRRMKRLGLRGRAQP